MPGKGGGRLSYCCWWDSRLCFSLSLLAYNLRHITHFCGNCAAQNKRRMKTRGTEKQRAQGGTFNLPLHSSCPSVDDTIISTHSVGGICRASAFIIFQTFVAYGGRDMFVAVLHLCRRRGARSAHFAETSSGSSSSTCCSGKWFWALLGVLCSSPYIAGVAAT